MPAFASSEAVAIIERNLGGKLLDKFESFEMQPIAAASLGQVTHPCRLWYQRWFPVLASCMYSCNYMHVLLQVSVLVIIAHYSSFVKHVLQLHRLFCAEV